MTDEVRLISRVKNAIANKGFALTFGQRVLMKFWLSYHVTSGYVFNPNAAENKWICNQDPEIDWDAVDDFWVETTLGNAFTKLPRIASQGDNNVSTRSPNAFSEGNFV